MKANLSWQLKCQAGPISVNRRSCGGFELSYRDIRYALTCTQSHAAHEYFPTPPASQVEREPNDGAAVATPVEAGRAVEGWLAPRGDEDWYAFTPPAPGRVRAALAGAPAGSAPTLRILDGKRALLASANGTSVTADVAEAGAPIYVVVKDHAGKASAASYSLTVTVEGAP